MKANELRINNWVYDNESQEDIKIERGEHIEYSRLYEPIPLTEEWLIKFGATYKREDTEHFIRHWYVFDSIRVKIEQWKKDNTYDLTYGVYKDYEHIKDVEYVHELQNICYELQEELKTKKE